MNIYLRRTTVLAFALSVALAGATSFGNAAEQNPDPAQIARGAKAWASTCGTCHNIRPPGDQTDGEWKLSIAHMRSLANVPGDTADDIRAFLQASN